MAILYNVTNGSKIYLRTHHVFGRDREKADTVLGSKDISQIHASIRWDGLGWTITDLSRNGVWIDGIRIEPGKNIALKEGNTIRLGILDPEAIWELTELTAPGTLLIPINDHGQVIELNRFHVLPDEKSPDISIYISARGQWVYETEQGVSPLVNGDIIHHGSGSWRFFSAEPVDVTLQRNESVGMSVNFHVSLDEEHVVVKIHHGPSVFDLGERAHHYMLLTLARQRLVDASQGVDADTQGWVPLTQLTDMLNIAPDHLNIHIFRIRKQVSSVIPVSSNLPQVVERRVGEIRFGFPDFQIFRGASIEGTLSGGQKL